MTMGEKSLHDSVKLWYSREGDEIEKEVDGYVVDVVRGDLLIEVQTANFSAIRDKLRRLVRAHPVRLVHPISERKWIVRVDGDGETVLSRRRSPKKGRVEDVFYELVYMPNLLAEENMSLEVLLVHSEDVLIDDGRGSWRRRRWSIHDRRLLDVVDQVRFNGPEDLLDLLPVDLPEKFTSREVAEALSLRPAAAQKMTYCLRKMGVLREAGRRGRALQYLNPRGQNQAI